MKITISRVNIIFILVILAIGSGCTPDIPPELTPTKAVNSPVSSTSTPTLTSSPSPEPTKITNIVIDGQPDDWSGREFPVSDPPTDGTSGYLEIVAGTIFLNRDAVYFMLEFADPTASFVLFDINIQVDGKPLQIGWQPGQMKVLKVDWSSGEGKRLGWTENTTYAFESVLEGRIDLDDLGNPGTISGFSVMVMAEIEGKGWSPADIFIVDEISSVFEKDTLRMSSSEDKYYYARFWNLPEGYVAENLFQSQVPNNSYIARSEDGTIYAQSWGDKPEVILIDPVLGKATSILSLPAYIGLGRILGGPGNSAFINVESQVWQIFPDGSHETIGSLGFAFIRDYTPDGRFLAIAHNGSELIEWKPDGTTQTIASGFQGLDDVVTRKDGTIFVYEYLLGNTTRLNPDGSRKILVANKVRGEHFSLALDFNENLYGNYGTGDVTRIDAETGQQTPLPFVSSPCAFNLGGFVITDEGKVIMTGDQLVWADLNTGGNGILIPNPASTFAAEIGPDDALYIGTPGCGDQFPAQVIRIEDDGTRSVYLDGLRDTIDSIAFGQDGALYIATRDTTGNHLFYLGQPGDTLIEIPGAPQG